MKRKRKGIHLLAILILLIYMLCGCAHTSSSIDSSIPDPISSEYILPDCYTVGWQEYLKQESDFWKYSDEDFGNGTFQLDETGRYHECENGAGHVLYHPKEGDSVCLLQLSADEWVFYGSFHYGALLYNKTEFRLIVVDHLGKKTTLFDVDAPIVELDAQDPVYYVAFSDSVWRGTFDGLWECVYQIPADESHYTLSYIHPISTTDIRIHLLDQSVPQIQNWQGTGDGFSYKCFIYSALTKKTYEITDDPYPNLTDYLQDRNQDIITLGEDPKSLCCQDMSIYQSYGMY